MSDWLDGPRFMSWLDEQEGRPLGKEVGPIFVRRICEWRNGASASVWGADRLLVQRGLHISLVPEEIWLDRKGPRTRYSRRTFIPKTTKERAIRLCESGVPAEQLAGEIGVTERTVRKWISERRQRAAQ